MDRKLEKKFWTRQRILYSAGGGLVLVLVLYGFLFADKRSKVNVNAQQMTVGTISKGSFQEFIPVTGTVQPINTIYIDAVEGGTIQRKLRESGAMVTAGEPLVLLTNSRLQLDVMTRETGLFEQINNLRNSRLQLEQNSLSLKNALAEIDYQISLSKPQYERSVQMYKDRAISLRDLELAKEQIDYQLKRRALTYESYKRDSILRVSQAVQLDESEQRLWRNMKAIGAIADNLLITAPISGQFTCPDLQIGQTVNAGTRLGQVDILNNYKVRVLVDELYLPRIATGQMGTFELAGQNYKLRIVKVFPTITDGRFQVDMEFDGATPKGVQRGQTVHIRLELGNPAQAVLLPMGGFYKDTGGNWVFVVDADGKRAQKRNIKLGRRNPDYLEVLEGLQPGEKVVTNSYENYGDNEVLVLE